MEKERDRLGGHELRRHDEIAFVLAVLVVDDDDHLAAGDGGDGFFDACEFHGSIIPGRPGGPKIRTRRRTITHDADFGGVVNELVEDVHQEGDDQVVAVRSGHRPQRPPQLVLGHRGDQAGPGRVLSVT